MIDLTIAVFSYAGHQQLLPYLLTSIKQHGPQAIETVLVWDDLRQQTQHLDMRVLEQAAGCKLKLLRQSQLYDWPGAVRKWGWIRQQLAKMLCYRYSDSKYIWIVDGDVLLQSDPQLFDPDNKPYLRYHVRSTDPAYLDFIKQYFVIDRFSPHDFVASTFLFENQVCQDIDQRSRAITDMDLVGCVNDRISRHDCPQFPFSEFATYGTWVYNYCADRYHFVSRNWNHAPAETEWHQPIQVMWDNIPGQSTWEFDAKIRWLAQQHRGLTCG